MPTNASVKFEVRGLKEAQRNLERAVRDLQGEPILNAMRDSTLLVTRNAKINAPVDTGRLRASITPSVASMKETVTGIVGSNVKYAPYVELGTKFMKPRKYLQRALEQAMDYIIRRFDRAANEVAKKANG
ncbi:MAG: HK97-gp10 family putative phage morphogenesis protein [Candidatus Paceibacterota bacterium]|jgi:HK97 gp10 family phage protein